MLTEIMSAVMEELDWQLGYKSGVAMVKRWGNSITAYHSDTGQPLVTASSAGTMDCPPGCSSCWM